MDDIIEKHLSSLNLDVRKTHFSRFIDQKCTPDVVSFIADCILEHTKNDRNKKFTVNDIWNTPYAIENAVRVFNKPSPDNPEAQNEYDKFFAQPIRLLFYAQILVAAEKDNSHLYKCENLQILDFIAQKSDNTLDFLFLYLKKVLTDSGFLGNIEKFREHQTKSNLQKLKDEFQQFMHKNTPVRGIFEPNRMFPKVLNVFAVKWKMKGIERGYITDYSFNQSDLLYNRINWRDYGMKDKRITRSEAEVVAEKRPQFVQYEIAKAKSLLERIHGQVSEMHDEWAHGSATQKHHMFPVSEYPKFSTYIENLITLTPTQHFTKAHPQNNTNAIDQKYQKLMLTAKSHSIEKSIIDGQAYYRKEKFIELLNECLRLNLPDNASFNEIRKKLG